MRLYDGKNLAHPRRLSIYLAEKGLTLDTVRLEKGPAGTKSADFLEKNPIGRVPLLELDDGTFLPESAAIVEYLEELYPDPTMLGDTPEERAQARASERIATSIFAWLPFVIVHTEPGLGEKRGMVQNVDVANAIRPFAEEQLDYLEYRVGEHPFLAGHRPTVADCTFFALVDTTYREFTYRLSSQRWPRLNSWYERFAQRPSAQA